MNFFFRLFVIAFLAACLSACGFGASEEIPLSIQTGKGTVHLKVEVARTEAEQKRGLQFRKSLPPDGGMLFPLTPPREASFWMKDTLIPLDMIFIRTDGTIARIEPDTTPESKIPVYAGEFVGAVLEIAGGEARKRGIEEGNKVSWRDPKG